MLVADALRLGGAILTQYPDLVIFIKFSTIRVNMFYL
jgi:hypothetical protein